MRLSVCLELARDKNPEKNRVGKCSKFGSPFQSEKVWLEPKKNIFQAGHGDEQRQDEHDLTTWEALSCTAIRTWAIDQELHTTGIPWGRVSRTPAGLTGSRVEGGRTRHLPLWSTLVVPSPTQPGPGARGRIQEHTRLEPDSTIERTTQSACREPAVISDERWNSRNHPKLHWQAMIKKFLHTITNQTWRMSRADCTGCCQFSRNRDHGNTCLIRPKPRP